MKKTIIMMLLSVAMLTANNVIAAEPASPEPKVYDMVEKMPSFPGGSEALKEYLKKNTTISARSAKTIHCFRQRKCRPGWAAFH